MNFLRLHNRSLLTFLLLGAFLWGLASVPWQQGVLHSGGWNTIGQLLTAMVTPALSPDILQIGFVASMRTVAYATCGMTGALLLAIPLGVLASGVLHRSALFQWISTGLFRGLLGFMRAVHELVWAWLLVAAFGLTPYAAIVAVAIPYGGILGRILADMINDVEEKPLQALRATGASEGQILIYGRIPQALADVISYSMYRYECAIRSAAIMSFIGLGGLGYQIQISMDDLHFSEAWTFIYMLVALVVVLSWWSSRIRKALVQ